MRATKVTKGKRVIGVIKGPFISKEYASGACYGFEQSARVTLWGLCSICKRKSFDVSFETCETPAACSKLRELAERLRGYKKATIKASKYKGFALAAETRRKEDESERQSRRPHEDQI
jgi:hypothetical protein